MPSSASASVALADNRLAAKGKHAVPVSTTQITMTTGGIVNGALSGAGEVVCPKRPPAVPSYDDGTTQTAIPPDAGRAACGQPVAADGNRPAGPVLGHRWGHYRCRNR